MKNIVSLNELTPESYPFAGGKGTALAAMKQQKLPVPEGFVVLSRAFCGGELSDSEKSEIARHLAAFTKRTSFAVRSSALHEDSGKASFAGAYETVLAVSNTDVLSAIQKVAASMHAQRVQTYAGSRNIPADGQMAVVVQKFIRPQFAGVLFTSDPITGSAAKMTGNYVTGVGEPLVSGDVNGQGFTFDSLYYSYSGPEELRPYARRLFRLAGKIARFFECPQDIEWAAAGGRVYVLQARPVTTLRRIDYDTFEINASLSGDYLFANTNVGEGFPNVITPMMWSLVESTSRTMGFPHFLDNICGHPYANMSVVYAGLKSFGFSKKLIRIITGDIAGQIPDNMEIPIFPFDKKYVRSALAGLFHRHALNKFSNMKTSEFLDRCEDLFREEMEIIHASGTNDSLLEVWQRNVGPFIRKLEISMFKNLRIGGIFNTRKEFIALIGEETANTLCSNCSGEDVLESMKPALFLEKVISGEISKTEYIEKYGHRSPEELEAGTPFPYENEQYIDNLIENYRSSGVSAVLLQKKQKERFEEAKTVFLQKYPRKARWLDRKIAWLQKSMQSREIVRSKGIRFVCILREFLLQCGKVNGIDGNVFYLYFDEAMDMLRGDNSALVHIAARKHTYEKYKLLPTFPSVIRGRFDPYEWMKSEDRNIDYFDGVHGRQPEDGNDEADRLTGFAGASGIVEGIVRVLNDFSEMNSLKTGEILVTAMTNIGWTPIFPRAAAIITNIGAPLSHAAIVAREFGIPAVVGCRNATARLRTGDRVRVDGGKGIVTILSQV
ncbi:MAG: PEP/pyruvate-binding domain-containing protein [Eubacteriales bacterium]